MHQKYWDNRQDCQQTKMMLPKVGNKMWKQLSNYPRSRMNLITQLYTGHTTLKRHLNVMAIEEDGRCEQCEEEFTEETVEHFLTDCPAFARNRQQTLGNISFSAELLPRLPLSKIVRFVNQTKRFEI